MKENALQPTSNDLDPDDEASDPRFTAWQKLRDEANVLAVKIARAKKAGEPTDDLLEEWRELKLRLDSARAELPYRDRKEDAHRVPLPECIPRRLYKLKCRNLIMGVFDGDQGFIGIRQKWASKFLDTEYHWDQGPPYGTVYGVEDTGIDMPADVQLCSSPGTIDQVTERWVAFDKPVNEGGKGWYFTDTGEPSPDIRPCGKKNEALFDWLTAQGGDPSNRSGMAPKSIREILKEKDSPD